MTLTQATQPEVIAPRSASSAAPAPSWPATQWTHSDIVERARSLQVGSRTNEKRTTRATATNRLLTWLASFPGATWQERWQASGSNEALSAWNEAPTDFTCNNTQPQVSRAASRRSAMVGLTMLLCLGVIRPSYKFLFAIRVKYTYAFIQALTDAEFFAEAFTRCHDEGITGRNLFGALNHITRIVMHTGRPPRELTTDDLLSYYTEVVAFQHLGGMAVSWDIMQRTGVFPPGTPTLRAARQRGQLTVAEMVDSYDVHCQPIRDMLVRYLSERAPSVDYNTLAKSTSILVSLFWKDLEEHHPGIDSLDLSPEVARGWIERAHVQQTGRGKGQKRQTVYSNFFLVRAFYHDIAQWALEEPYWARWAAPCPVRDEHVRGALKHQRSRRARMHQRTRTLAPLLPHLISSIEARLRYVEQLSTAAKQTPVDATFAVDGELFVRTQARSDTLARGQGGARHLRCRRLADDQALDLTQDEDDAFWTWGCVETLRHTGVRIEELLELTHLALVTHRLADTGEVVPLLQIVPSKQDEERVLLVSPELAHVLARIVHRVRAEKENIPLVARYDPHERVTGPPLPHLFQRWNGTERRILTPGVVQRLITDALERLGLRGPDGNPVRYTPHDFRRIFATEAVAAGLPIHIAAKLLGHRSLDTTQVYTAVYQDDVLRQHAAFIARRRVERPAEEYREPTATEWAEFERHFTRRKVELGTCARPYGTPCRHEHSCLRCPMLRPDPAQAMRLAEIITNLHERIREATDRGWLGEVEGLQVSLAGARQKLTQMRKLRQTTIALGPTRVR
ncbi:tyrosine-type recombinase/integrase [Actinoplanes sp. G11-F43]|uniref:tyrosine-type recombinase/integrase n=1 Tax=Actinoplanes sp. G11-F43 TaxID=3424130 RepID=UPI003D338BAB